MTASKIEMTAALQTGLDKESMETLIGGFGATSDMIAKKGLYYLKNISDHVTKL